MSKSTKSLEDPILFASILIIIPLFIMIYTKKYKYQTSEKFEAMSQSQNQNTFSSSDPVFYPSTMRTRDFQDLLSITESQINKKNER